jgi:hypothetical protein
MVNAEVSFINGPHQGTCQEKSLWVMLGTQTDSPIYISVKYVGGCTTTVLHNPSIRSVCPNVTGPIGQRCIV